jgi:glycosyltransferase involved in cell wall biosynthesis
MLARLLSELEEQETQSLFDYSIVIVDNDAAESARQTVESWSRQSKNSIKYCVEPEQSIALARNRAVENARGDFIAFIDDDEFPAENWLLDLFKAYNEFKTDGILGPVLPHYETKPPEWVIKGKFYERPSHKTGTILDWTNTRTGNVLLRRDLFDGRDNMFRPEFGSGGEDRDLFRRLIGQGCQFAWCAEAPVFEVVPPERCKRSFMLRRALLRGKTPYNRNFGSYLKSLIAIPSYTLALPFLLCTSQHSFMKCLIKCFDHVGRILAFVRVHVVKEKYVVK